MDWERAGCLPTRPETVWKESRGLTWRQCPCLDVIFVCRSLKSNCMRHDIFRWGAGSTPTSRWQGTAVCDFGGVATCRLALSVNDGRRGTQGNPERTSVNANVNWPAASAYVGALLGSSGGNLHWSLWKVRRTRLLVEASQIRERSSQCCFRESQGSVSSVALPRGADHKAPCGDEA